MAGAAAQMASSLAETRENPSAVYAAARQALYRRGQKVEVLSYPGESSRFLAEWWKQLYGESEGKQGLGIFPASCELTADLHSLGQYHSGRRAYPPGDHAAVCAQRAPRGRFRARRPMRTA